MHWATVLLSAACSLTAVSAQIDSYTPGSAPSPFPSQAAAARLKIDPQTACDTANDTSKPRNVQLAAWVECRLQGFYPYPRTEDPKNTDWLATFLDTVHPTARCSFNGTKYNRDGFVEVYKAFSNIIGQSFSEWRQWRDYWVASPDSWNTTSIGGQVSGQGFNGGVFRNGARLYAPNSAYFIVKDIGGRRWITEFREHGTLASAGPLPKDGQLWPCDPEYEICG